MKIAEYLGKEEQQQLQMATCLRELEIAFRLLLRIEFVHQSSSRPMPSHEPLYVSDAIQVLAPAMSPLDFQLHRDAFMIDLVGNTICADLLDYGRRDAVNAGLKVQFDERLIVFVSRLERVWMR